MAYSLYGGGKTSYGNITKDSQVSDAMIMRNIGGKGGY